MTKFMRKYKKLALVMTIAAMIAATVIPASAATSTGLELIGGSPNQYRSSITAPSYGLDPTLPVILAFNDTLGSAIGSEDITITLGSTTIDNGTVAKSGNQITLHPQLVAGNVYTVSFTGDLAGINSFQFRTKTGGTGGGVAIPYCVGKIVDGNLTGTTVAMVPADQTFFFTFANNISIASNDSKIHLRKWVGGATYDSTSTNPSDWETVATVNTFNANGSRWNVSVDPTVNLTSGSIYNLYFDGSFVANNGQSIGNGEVNESFKVK